MDFKFISPFRRSGMSRGPGSTRVSQMAYRWARCSAWDDRSWRHCSSWRSAVFRFTVTCTAAMSSCRTGQPGESVVDWDPLNC